MKNTLKTWLKKNQLASDPNGYVASVVSNGRVGLKQIIDETINNGTELKREVILRVIT